MAALDTKRAARDLKTNRLAAAAAEHAGSLLGANGAGATRGPRPGVPDAAPALDPYGDAIAKAIGAIFFELVKAGMQFSAGRMGAGDHHLRQAAIKIDTLRAQRRGAPQSRRR